MRKRAGWATLLTTETLALYWALWDRRTPKAVKLLAVAVLVYALSPIDLVPEVVPVLGVVDDVAVVSAGVWQVKRMIPAGVLAAARERASGVRGKVGRVVVGVVAGACVVAAAVLAGVAWWAVR